MLFKKEKVLEKVFYGGGISLFVYFFFFFLNRTNFFKNRYYTPFGNFEKRYFQIKFSHLHHIFLSNLYND